MQDGRCIVSCTSKAPTSSKYDSKDELMRQEVKKRIYRYDSISEEEEEEEIEEEAHKKDTKAKQWLQNPKRSTIVISKTLKTTSFTSTTIQKHKTTVHKSVHVEKCTTSRMLCTTEKERRPGKTYGATTEGKCEDEEGELSAVNASRSSTPGGRSRSSTPGFSLVNSVMNRKCKSPSVPDCDNKKMLSPPLATSIRDFAFHDQENTFPYHFGMYYSQIPDSTFSSTVCGFDIGLRSVFCESSNFGMSTLEEFVTSVPVSPNTIVLLHESHIEVARRISEEYVQLSSGICIHVTPDFRYVAHSRTISRSMLKGVIVVDCSAQFPCIYLDADDENICLRQTYQRRIHPFEDMSKKFICLVSNCVFSGTELSQCICDSEGIQIPLAFKTNRVTNSCINFKDVVFNSGSVPDKRITEEAQLRFELVHDGTCIAFLCFPILMFNSFHQLKRNVVKHSVPDSRVKEMQDGLAVEDLATILDMEESEFPLFFNVTHQKKYKKKCEKLKEKHRHRHTEESLEDQGWTLPPLQSTYKGQHF